MDVLWFWFSHFCFLVYFISEELPSGWVSENWKEDSMFLKVSFQSVKYHHSSQNFSLTILRQTFTSNISFLLPSDWCCWLQPKPWLKTFMIRNPGLFLHTRVYWKTVSIILSLAQVFIITKMLWDVARKNSWCLASKISCLFDSTSMFWKKK